MNKLIIIPITIISILSYGQNVRDTSIFAPIFSVNYAIQLPGGDLSSSFGMNNNIGFSGGIKTATNWSFDLEGTFIFGENVKDTSIIDHLQNSQGWIINQTGEENNILIFERGQTLTFNAGKIFNVIGPNPNSGIIVKLGMGFMRHKIRIENENNLVPQLDQDHLPYYDRLTMGIHFHQFIGYQHMSNNRLTNFNIGFDFYQGFTQGMRDYQIDFMGPYLDKRIDLLSGIRVGWIIPVFRQAPKEYYID